MNWTVGRVRTGVVGLLCAGALASSLGACGGAGRYGYAQTYVYLPDEEPVARGANQNALYDEVRRMPDRFAGQTISWFGIVEEATLADTGTVRAEMQVRNHQARHLCEDESDSSCRVTINEANGGRFTATFRARPEDLTGENRVQAGSLVRVYGTLVQGETDEEGGPVLRGTYYRHWPRGQYLTTAARGQMRR